jgi:hypothetical protein
MRRRIRGSWRGCRSCPMSAEGWSGTNGVKPVLESSRCVFPVSLSFLSLANCLERLQLGADLVESSFSAVSGPITSRLGGVDDFACRQLDRISVVGSPGRKSPASQAQQLPAGSGVAAVEEERRGRSTEETPVDLQAGGGGQGTSSFGAGGEREPSRARDTSAGQVVAQQRSRWQTVLVEAGGLGAAVSEESLKSLRYCLQWLLVRHLFFL